MDTIFAQATAYGRAGVAVIRISGPSAGAAVVALCGELPAPRLATLRTIKTSDGELLDSGLVLWFPAPGSFTGEDVAELQIHGGTASVRSVLNALKALPGLHLAEPGEFTRRALVNGKIDLTQVEGLADLIDAETDVQLKQAKRVMSGTLSKMASEWRQKLVRAAALIETTIDFSDEDIPDDLSEEILSILESLAADFEKELKGSVVSERVRDGFEVAIVGRPNVGKSQLLNCLAGRDAAITSCVAGTTRDVVEVRMDLRGLPVTFLDTAGIRESEDEVEKIGIDRAVRRASDADLRIFLMDEEEDDIPIDYLDGDLRRVPKGDLRGCPAGSVSGQTGYGVGELLQAVADELYSMPVMDGILTRERHKEHVEAALLGVSKASGLIRSGDLGMDIAADHLRNAVLQMAFLVGSIDVDNLLDEIFTSFCMGK